MEQGRMTNRNEVNGAGNDRLFFAQVREDPTVELAALAPGPADRVVVIASGGCTALSLLAAGAAEVHAVDVNRTQNHLVELKVAALSTLPLREAIAFLGGVPSDASTRARTYSRVGARLSAAARAYWDEHPAAIRRGVLNAGVSERFIALVAWLVVHVAQSPGRVRRLLDCATVGEQRALFDAEWNNWRWRMLFRLLLNRWSMSRVYDPSFFVHVGRRSFSELFRRMAEHAIADLPVADNYFLHHMLTGRFPASGPDGLPPYLTEHGARAVAHGAQRLTLVDGSVLEYLRRRPDRSVECLALSNVCEWLAPEDIAALFGEVERVATPGARVVFRNFVGWTDVPATCTHLVEDRALGERLVQRDRSVIQPRVVVCRVAASAAEAAA